MIHAQRNQIIHFDCINRLHTCEPCNIYGFSMQHVHRAAAFVCVFPIFSSSARSHCKWNGCRWKAEPRPLDSPSTFLQDECGMTDWLVGRLTDRLRSNLNWNTREGKKGPERTCHVSSADMETHERREEQRVGGRTGGCGEQSETVRQIGISLYALCGGSHACAPHGLGSNLAHVTSPCCVPLAQRSVFMCAGTDLVLCSLVMSWFLAWALLERLCGLAYDCSGMGCTRCSSICNAPRTNSETSAWEENYNFGIRIKLRVRFFFRYVQIS